MLAGRTTCASRSCSLTRGCSWWPSASASAESAQHRHELAEHRHVGWVEHHRLHRRIRRGQGDLAVRLREGLDGRFVSGDAGHDDVAVVRRRLLTADDEVAVQDAGVDHRLAAHAQHEQLAVAGEVHRQGNEFFDVFLGEDVDARGHVTDERDVLGWAPLHGDATRSLVADFDGAGLGWVAVEVAHLLEGG